ncbi:site-2 protease family protein [Candidatus Saccharibacteria bacterium]|nr:site-2 protease family protein [Candidatus Saccharibacteria bacterium]MBR2658344.1 site-2 protease family protein [Candidatus Saccharibacteria bacterium]
MDNILIVLVIILVSVILHELTHGIVAYLLGDTTAKDEGRLSLNPLKHIDPVISILVPLVMVILGGPVFGGAKPVPVDSRKLKGGAWGMALVAIAGPLMNLLLAFVAFLIGHFTGVIYQNGLVMQTVILQFIFVNLGFFVFNILPLPPLDGSRVLYAIAPDGAREVMERVEKTFGVYLVFALILVAGSALSNLMSEAIMGIFRFFLMLVGVAA